MHTVGQISGFLLNLSFFLWFSAFEQEAQVYFITLTTTALPGAVFNVLSGTCTKLSHNVFNPTCAFPRSNKVSTSTVSPHIVSGRNNSFIFRCPIVIPPNYLHDGTSQNEMKCTAEQLLSKMFTFYET